MRKKRTHKVFSVQTCTTFLSVLVALGFTLFPSTDSHSQTLDLSTFGRYDSIVVIDQDTMLNPWAGGLNAPQFSSIDLNGDGLNDLFVFDRDGFNPRTFINNGHTNGRAFQHNPTYESAFPVMWNYAQLVDYNSDGKPDIFTCADIGDFRVFLNTSTGFHEDSMSFEKQFFKEPWDSTLQVDYLTYKFFLPQSSDYFYTNLYNEQTDLASFIDYDYDGDIDILSFGNGASSVSLYENKSMDIWGHTDSLEFRFSTNCWGHFQEDFFEFYLRLNDCQGNMPQRGRNVSRGSRHVGSTVFVHDIDSNSLPDILLGDISFTHVVAGFNGGSYRKDKIVNQDTNYPRYDVPVDLTSFPGIFYFDADNDQTEDMIFAPNATEYFENVNQVWRYKNIGSKYKVDLRYQENDFLVGDMIDLGSDAHPTFFDVDGDTLLDIVCGSFGEFTSSYTYESRLSYYKNTGTKTDPSYELITRDLVYLPQGADTGLVPTFGDMDNDGDQDLILGTHDGYLLYFENNPSQTDSAIFTHKPMHFDTLFVGKGARPFIYDVNGDGLNDLLVGSQYSRITYYKNIGTASSPNFHHAVANEHFGKIDVSDDIGFGYLRPFMARMDSSGYPNDTSGETYLFVGASTGEVYLFNNIDTAGTNSFNEVGKLYVYTRNASPALGDITGDGKLDMIFGQKTGGLSILLKDGGNIIVQPPEEPEDTTSVEEFDSLNDFQLFPNPAGDQLNIIASGHTGEGKVDIYSMQGVLIFSEPIENVSEFTLNISDLNQGTYLLHLQAKDLSSMRTFMRMR
jgi:hypothetical protein